MNYFKLAKSLIEFIKVFVKDFLYSWNSQKFEKVVFQVLKEAFIKVFVFQYFDFDKKTWIEIDVSNYVVVAILSQIKSDEKLHSIVYFFKRMSFIECNCEIYDKKLLIIVWIFEKWRLKCAKTSMKDFIKILINHKNLKHFMIIKQLNRRQIKWTEFLSKFNFKIFYKSNVQNIKSNNFTRRSKNLSTLKNNDNFKKKHNFVKILKKEHLNKKIKNAVNLIVVFFDENFQNIVWLIVMIYDLSEENSSAKKKIVDEFNANVLVKKEKRKIVEKSFFDFFDVRFDIMSLIRTAYSKKTSFFNALWKLNAKTNVNCSSTSSKQILNLNWMTATLKKIFFESKIEFTYFRTKSYIKKYLNKFTILQLMITSIEILHTINSINIIIDRKWLTSSIVTSRFFYIAKKQKITEIQNKNCSNFFLYSNDIFKIFSLISSRFFLNVIVMIEIISTLW